MARDPQALPVQGADTLGTPVQVTVQPPGGGPGPPTILASTASAGNTSNVATLGGAAGKLTYLTHIRVNGLGATGAITATLTITGLKGGTIVYQITVPAGITVPITPIDVDLAWPWSASAQATAIQATLSAFGAGNTAAEVSLVGYQV